VKNGSRRRAKAATKKRQKSNVSIPGRAGRVGSALLIPLAVFASPSILSYATYLNGSSANAIVVDSSGNTIVAGNGFVVKLDPTGARILNSISLPGDNVAAAALDSSGNLAIAGSTGSASAGGFVAKLDPAGKTLFFNTLANAAAALALDASGNIYLTGATASTPSRGTDAFVAMFSSAGTLVYSTTIGGSANDAGRAIAVDAQGDAYIAGDTESADFPVTPGAAQTKFGGLVSVFGIGSFGDAFVAKLNPSGASVIFATYWGGAAPDIAYAITVDSAGNAYVAGATSSSDFPVTVGAFQTAYSGPAANPADPDPDGDAFVAKFSPLGAAVWSTLWGGSQADVAYAIALDAAGSVYIAGTTESPGFPKSGNSIPTCRNTGGPFVAELDPTGAKLLHSTGMSGLGYDNAFALTVGPAGAIYLAGETESQVFFSTPGAAQTTFGGVSGTYQAFAAGIDFSTQPFTAPPGTYAACVLNAASFAAGNAAPFPLGTVAPGEIVSVFGSNLGPGAPTVTFDGIPAPVLYAGANQINAVVPYGLGPTSTQMTVQFNGQSYGPVAMPVAAAVPGIFTLDGSGHGQAAVLNQDGTLNSISNPAARGSIITFFACGAGLMTPAVANGTITPPGMLPVPTPVLPVTVAIRGVTAMVEYAGAAPGYVSGLLQVNAQVPTSIDFGNLVPLMLNLGSFASQLDITIALK
jgi:uncharacterized protein (TIGR03437 family)